MILVGLERDDSALKDLLSGLRDEPSRTYCALLTAVMNCVPFCVKPLRQGRCEGASCQTGQDHMCRARARWPGRDVPSSGLGLARLGHGLGLSTPGRRPRSTPGRPLAQSSAQPWRASVQAGQGQEALLGEPVQRGLLRDQNLADTILLEVRAHGREQEARGPV